MTWLRIDDGFAEHGKVLELVRKDRWTWMELLCYCARQSSGRVPVGITGLLQHVTPEFLHRCVAAGLLDRDEHGGLEVHDWAVYNPKDPTGAVRQSRFRNAKRNGESNGENRYDRNASRVGARARSRPDPPTPIEEGKGREVSEETDAAAHATPNGAAPLIDCPRPGCHISFRSHTDLHDHLAAEHAEGAAAL